MSIATASTAYASTDPQATPAVIAVDAFLAPCDGDEPAGADIGQDYSPASPFFKLKDARTAERVLVADDEDPGMTGARAWNAQGRFRLLIGPLNEADFRYFMPDEPALQRLTGLVRLYVGAEYDIDIQVTLAAATVPALRLPNEGEDSAAAPRLGWNT